MESLRTAKQMDADVSLLANEQNIWLLFKVGSSHIKTKTLWREHLDTMVRLLLEMEWFGVNYRRARCWPCKTTGIWAERDSLMDEMEEWRWSKSLMVLFKFLRETFSAWWSHLSRSCVFQEINLMRGYKGKSFFNQTIKEIAPATFPVDISLSFALSDLWLNHIKHVISYCLWILKDFSKPPSWLSVKSEQHQTFFWFHMP